MCGLEPAPRWNLVVGEEKLAAALVNSDQLVLAYQRLQAIDSPLAREDVIPFGAVPSFQKLAVVQKSIRRPRRIRAIDHIVESTVQQERGPVGVKEHR